MTVGRFDAVFISWVHHCARSDAIAHALGIESVKISRLDGRPPVTLPIRYLWQAMDTVRLLARRRPSFVIVMDPPFLGVAIVAAYSLLRSVRFVVDAHSPTFQDPAWTWAQPFLRFFTKRSQAIVVTGPELAEVVRSWGRRPLQIADVPMEYDVARTSPGETTRCFVVNTFSRDEPLADLLLAASQLDGEMTFAVSGDTRKKREDLVAPPNVRFTGFVDREVYVDELRSADIVVVLTTHDLTMQRGGYEAMYAGRPLVTSDWALLRRTFSRGAIFVDNTPDGIVNGLRAARSAHEELQNAMASLRAERVEAFAEVLEQLISVGAPRKEREHG